MIQAKLLHQQHFESLIGPEAARTLCAPTALYACAQLAGYELPAPETYVGKLNRKDWSPTTCGWSRAGLSGMLRDYDMPVVSWHTSETGRPQDQPSIDAMRVAGYIATTEEESFLRNVVMQSSLVEIAQAIPVVITVTPGFAHNRAHHAVLITDVAENGDSFTIFDPDSESPLTTASRDHLEKHLDTRGACTIILPAVPGTTE